MSNDNDRARRVSQQIDLEMAKSAYAREAERVAALTPAAVPLPGNPLGPVP